MKAEKLIKSGEVWKLWVEAHFKPGEIQQDGKGQWILPEGTPIIEVLGNSRTCFNKERLEAGRQKVVGWLAALPDQFRGLGVRHGWNLEMICFQKDGVRWTKIEDRAVALMYVAVGLGLAEWTSSFLRNGPRLRMDEDEQIPGFKIK